MAGNLLALAPRENQKIIKNFLFKECDSRYFFMLTASYEAFILKWTVSVMEPYTVLSQEITRIRNVFIYTFAPWNVNNNAHRLSTIQFQNDLQSTPAPLRFDQ